MFGNLCQHSGSDFVLIVKREDQIWESGPLKDSVRAASALDRPARPEQSGEYSAGLGGGPVAHAASNIKLDGTGSSSPILYAIGDHAQSERFDGRERGCASFTVGEHTR